MSLCCCFAKGGRPLRNCVQLSCLHVQIKINDRTMQCYITQSKSLGSENRHFVADTRNVPRSAHGALRNFVHFSSLHVQHFHRLRSGAAASALTIRAIWSLLLQDGDNSPSRTQRSKDSFGSQLKKCSHFLLSLTVSLRLTASQ